MWPTRALIDSGAPRCIFDRGAAEAMAVDFDVPPEKRIQHLVGGSYRWAVTDRVQLRLHEFPDFMWEAEVDFLEEEDWQLPFVVLGHEGFLDRWTVTFHYYRNYFVIQPCDDFEPTVPPDVAARYHQ